MTKARWAALVMLIAATLVSSVGLAREDVDPKVTAKLPDDVIARGFAVLQDLDRKRRLVEAALQVGMEVIDVVEATRQSADIRRIVVDPNQQGIDPLAHRGVPVVFE